jgi:predicted secreted protein
MKIVLNGNINAYLLGSEDNQITTAHINQILQVKIRGNPTTGYGWFIINLSNLDQKVLKPLNLNEYNSTDDYITDTHPPGFVGVPGYYYFKFLPINISNGTLLTFVNKRPWEETDERTVNLTVKIIK